MTIMIMNMTELVNLLLFLFHCSASDMFMRGTETPSVVIIRLIFYKITLTAEILARSLANFHCQKADKHMSGILL